MTGIADRRRDLALALLLILAAGTAVSLARVLDARRPALQAMVEDEPPYLAPETARRLASGFAGLVADWYWLSALQYIGRTIQAAATSSPSAVQLDTSGRIRPQVLVPLFQMITTLDPRFVGVYEFAAVTLPAVDPEAAVALLEQGIRENPDQWYLHQQLAYIQWKRGEYALAADAFRRGARMTTARWMEHMAERLERQADDPHVARAMYARMYEQAQDDQVKQWALRRLMQLRSLEERETIRGALTRYTAAHGQCPRAWSEVAGPLREAGLTVHAEGPPLDPSGAPYLLVVTPLGCDVTLHPSSTVPRG